MSAEPGPAPPAGFAASYGTFNWRQGRGEQFQLGNLLATPAFQIEDEPLACTSGTATSERTSGLRIGPRRLRGLVVLDPKADEQTLALARETLDRLRF